MLLTTVRMYSKNMDIDVRINYFTLCASTLWFWEVLGTDQLVRSNI